MSFEEDPAPQAAPEGTTAQIDPAQELEAAAGEQQNPTENENQNDDGEQDQERPKHKPWYQQRIDELTRARREAERRAEALQAMYEQGNQQEHSQNQAQTQQQDPREIAKAIAAQERLTEAANRTYEAGKAEYPDFDRAVQQMTQVADLSQRTDFLEAVTSLPNAHKVYHHLGTNPDEAAHILSLPPMKMAMALADVSARVGKPRAQSKAPAPISPIGKSAAPSSELSDDLPMDVWLARREETARKRR